MKPSGATNRQDIVFLHNFSCERTCEWRYVHQRALPPAFLPDELSQYGTAFEVTNRDEWILKGSIQAGVFLNVTRLSQICAMLRCPLPGKNEGSGKNGRLVKIDYARALARFLWPTESEDFVNDIVSKLLGGKKEVHDLSVLSMMAELDTDNQDSFKRLKAQAMRTWEDKVFSRGRAAGQEEEKQHRKDKKQKKKEAKEKMAAAYQKADAIVENKKKADASETIKQWNLTPPELRRLLPGKGDIAGEFWMRWHPKQHWWRVTYPTSHLALF